MAYVLVSGRPAGEVYDREAVALPPQTTEAEADKQLAEMEARIQAEFPNEWAGWMNGPHVYNIEGDEVERFIKYRTGQSY